MVNRNQYLLYVIIALLGLAAIYPALLVIDLATIYFPFLATGLVVIIGWLLWTVWKEKLKVESLTSKKQSQSTLYGRINEQFAPFMEKYPFNQNSFRFIGSPIDGVQFENDKVIFVEIKSAKSELNPRQKRIRELIIAGKIEWFEFNIR
mgnify:CR=1 FL=1